MLRSACSAEQRVGFLRAAAYGDLPAWAGASGARSHRDRRRGFSGRPRMSVGPVGCIGPAAVARSGFAVCCGVLERQPARGRDRQPVSPFLASLFEAGF